MKSQLKKYKLKHTPIREELLKLFSESQNAIPFSEIQEKLKAFDRATVYRTLNTFTQKGIIHKITNEDGATFYANSKNVCGEHGHSHDHIHFECNSCKSIECLDLSTNLDINLNGYKIKETQINVRGLCPSCS